MNVIEEVKKLGLPLGEYVVVGSGGMSVHGIREALDIDLVVTPNIFAEFVHKGWAIYPIEHSDRKVLRSGIFEIASDWKCGVYQPETAEIIADADIIGGIPFVRLSRLADFKKELGREKDIADIRLIEEHMQAGNCQICKK